MIPFVRAAVALRRTGDVAIIDIVAPYSPPASKPRLRAPRLMDVVRAKAGGLNKGQFRATSIELADLSHAFLARNGEVLPVDFSRLLNQGDLRFNVQLQSGDLISIPSGLEQEIYVHPFPNVDAGRWQISRGGGNEPLWHPDGSELFYRQGDGGPVLAVTIEADPETPMFRAGPPRLLFDTLSWDSEPTYSISNDGERFLMVSSADIRARQNRDTVVVVVNNWFEELTRLAPPSDRE